MAYFNTYELGRPSFKHHPIKVNITENDTLGKVLRVWTDFKPAYTEEFKKAFPVRKYDPKKHTWDVEFSIENAKLLNELLKKHFKWNIDKMISNLEKPYALR